MAALSNYLFNYVDIQSSNWISLSSPVNEFLVGVLPHHCTDDYVSKVRGGAMDGSASGTKGAVLATNGLVLESASRDRLSMTLPVASIH